MEKGDAPLSIVVADDHILVRQGVVALINAQPDMEVVGQVGDGRAAVEMVATLRPDIAVLDLALPRLPGLAATREIVTRYPNTRVIILTFQGAASSVRELLGAGAAGYVLKRSATEDLIGAIQTVTQGGIFLAPGVAMVAGIDTRSTASGLPVPAEELSERESFVLRLIARGHTTQETADRLSVSVKTIETDKARACEKLGFDSRVDIMRYARVHGWLDESSGEESTRNDS